MKYLSVFSGMEAASVAWEPLGFKPIGFSEIEPFPCEILAHHFPNIRNYGDITKYKQWNIERGAADILVGGSPCQSFSSAGLRKGLEDPRGHLMLTFLGLADSLRPRWIVWENVPGVLSSAGGRDFGAFLGALGELGYGFAWRVLDAQHFGVPQRRRRVFLVATSTGDARLAAKVLSIPEGLRGYLETRRKKGQEVAGKAEDGAGGGSDEEVAAFRKSRRAQSNTDYETWVDDGKANTLNLFENTDVRTTHAIVHREGEITCQPDGISGTVSSKWAKGSGGPSGGEHVNMVVDKPLMFKIRGGNPVSTGERGGKPGMHAGKGYLGSEDKAFTIAVTQDQFLANVEPVYPINTLTLGGRPDPVNDARMTLGVGNDGDPQFTLQANHSHAVAHRLLVRRLTPLECERLQGFPDNWSRIPWKGKSAEDCPDGPRYQACGNSMAVPVMRWIGKRILEVEGGAK